MTHLRSLKLSTTLLVAFLLLVSVAVAAWFITQGSQSGGKIGTLTAPVVSAASPVGSGCLPGGTCSASVQVDNTTGSALTVSGTESLVGGFINGAPQQPSGFNSSCPSSVLSSPTKTGLSVSVPAGASTVTIPGVFTLDSSAPDACQGVAFTYPIKLTFKAGT